MANLDFNSVNSVKIDFLKQNYKLDGCNKAMSVIIIQNKNFKSTYIVAGFINMETAIWEVNATKEVKCDHKSILSKDIVYSFQAYQSESNIVTLLCGTEKGSLVKLEVEFTSEKENGEIVESVEVRTPNYRSLPKEEDYSPKSYKNSMTISKDERINQILIDKSQDPSFAFLCTFDSCLYKVPINFDTTNKVNNEDVNEKVFSFRDDNQTLKNIEITRLRSISIYTDSKKSKQSYLAIGGEYNKQGATGRVVIIKV